MLKNFFKCSRRNFFLQVAALFIPMASVVIGVAVYSYQDEKREAFRIAALHEQAVLKMGKSSIQQALEKLKNDVQYLSHYHDFEDYVATGSSENLEHITHDFKLVMQSHRVYDQLRWIDETGMERLRINFNNGAPALVPAEQLQEKKDRYYFLDAMQAREGEIYFSLFDLNVDKGKIEIPYKPMIRAATPIVNKEGERKGIFIINYLGDEVIQKFTEATAVSSGDVMLLNGEGYWLKGAKKSDEWGFMFNRYDLSLSHRYPSAWERIAKAEEGQFVDENGLWSFTTVHPGGHASGRVERESAWKALIRLPADKLYAQSNTKSHLTLYTILGLVAAGMASFALAYLYRKKRLALQNLSELHHRTEGILRSVPDMIMQVDNDKRYVWANDIGIDFFGEEVIGKEASFYFEGEQDTYAIVQPLFLGDNQAVYVESWQRRRDGEKRLLAWWCQTLKDEEGRVTGVLSTARDITDEKKIQQTLEESEKKYKNLAKAMEQVDDILYITDKFGTISYVNGAYCRHTGYSQAEVIGQNSRISKSGMHDQGFYKELWATILSGEVYRNTLINRKKNGDLYYEKKTITPLKNDYQEIVGFISSGKDVTQETMLHQEVERIATIDNLTGVYNRHKFEELFTLESERSRRFSHPLSMILIDIDHFKAVNDTYGHDVGDAVLKRLAEIVQESIRKIDIFARWGGEEFLVLSPNTDLENIQILAEKLRKAVEGADFPEIGEITISLGVSTFEKEDTFLELFKRADQGLYSAKQNGRNRIGISL